MFYFYCGSQLRPKQKVSAYVNDEKNNTYCETRPLMVTSPHVGWALNKYTTRTELLTALPSS